MNTAMQNTIASCKAALRRQPARIAMAALVCAAAPLLSACSSMASPGETPASHAQGTGLTAPARRITDERILADRYTVEAVQQRLRKLNESGIPQNSYPLAKAQCWIDTAKSQYQENDRTGYVEESLTEAMKIAQALEADPAARAGMDTPLIARSSKLRDDLWARLNTYKSQPATLACNARTVACAEVRLVRAGHADQQTGWRQALPHVQMAEDGLRTAKIEADACPQPKAGLAPVPPALVAPSGAAAAPGASAAQASPAALSAAVAPVGAKETFVLLTDALFEFNKSRAGDMVAGGARRLDEVANKLKTYRSIQTLTVIGHTDRLGSNAYNDALSQARAKTVLAYLQARGIQSAKATSLGKGKREAISSGCGAALGRTALIACLQADRRVTIEVGGLVR
jgi:OmpA-OmpF porin, OOP family